MKITPQMTDDLYDGQSEDWDLLKYNEIVLENALQNSKAFLVGDTFFKAEKFVVSYRRASQTADVAKALAGERPCFLCRPARPSQQQSLSADGYEVLCNPYPLTFPHFTIPSVTHVPQLIKGRIRDMAHIPGWFEDCCVIYNGPLCGASAPDHFHFQAVDAALMNNVLLALDIPAFDPVATCGKGRLLMPYPNVTPTPCFVIVSSAVRDLEYLFNRLYASLPAADPEPMMNIAMLRDDGDYVCAVFPRRRHRPSCYGDGKGQILISPATVEMLGFIPLSSEKDFRYLGEKRMAAIYSEVGITREQAEQIAQTLK